MLPAPRPLRRSIAVALAATLALAGCAGTAPSRFDSAAWQAQRGAEPQQNRRGAMLPALQQALRPGMARDEVIALLGPPDRHDAAAGSDVYELGVSGYGVDEAYYQLDYRDGKLVEHRLQRR